MYLITRQMMAAERVVGEMTLRQLCVLAYVIEHPGKSVKHIADALGLLKPTITRAIDALAADGLLMRDPCRTDRRQISVMATPSGKVVLEAILAGGEPEHLATTAA